MEEKIFMCECGRTFTNGQSFNGHKSHCKEHHLAKYGNLDYLNSFIKETSRKTGETNRKKAAEQKQQKLQQWISEQHTCEKCGKVMTEFYGSGRFCSVQCANSKEQTEEMNQKRRESILGSKAYSNGNKTIFVKKNQDAPDGFIHCNFSLVRNFDSFDDCVRNLELQYTRKPNSKQRNKQRNKRTNIQKQLLAVSDAILCHNNLILQEYESMLSRMSIGKTFDVKEDCVYAQYKAVYMTDHIKSVGYCVFLHVLLAEELLGRKLNKKEVVHHKDSDKLHNSFDNIYIFDSLGSHARFHHSKLYWLEINGDVLVCKKLTEDIIEPLLKDFC